MRTDFKMRIDFGAIRAAHVCALPHTSYLVPRTSNLTLLAVAFLHLVPRTQPYSSRSGFPLLMSDQASTATAPRAADSPPPSGSGQSLQDLCINAIRVLAMDAVQKADSGHPGTPMALAPLAYVLWTQHLRYNPANPGWLNRDRFVLSAGHASLLLYSVLYLTGYELTLDDLKQFRQWESKTP